MIETDKPERKLSYESYCHLRQGGEPASKVYQAWKEHQLMQDSIDTSSPFLALCNLLPLAVALMIVASMFHNLNAMRTHKIWITSPSGNTIRQLPLYQALRIIKRRKWRFTNVAPIIPRSSISRKNALKILLLGHKHNGEEL